MATIIVSDWGSFITAVGTSGADVEFPKHLVKTRDRNVDPNKLYVDANGIVQTNVQPSQLANLYENTFVLDANLNNDLKTGFTTPININCNSINGYGGYIKNIYSTGVHIFNMPNANVPISQIAFLNFNLERAALFNSTHQNDFELCLFSGREKGQSGSETYIFGSFYGGRTDFISCSFNLELITRIKPFYAGLFKFCRVELDLSENDNGEIALTPQNCYFTGDWSKGSINVYGVEFDCKYNIFEITCSNNFPQSTSGTKYNNLINNELYTGTIPTGFSGVTSTDLADAQTLRDTYDFPIQT